MPKVTFQKSGVEADWDPSKDYILDLAEESGLALDYSCRMGSCTACMQPIASGEVEYPEGHSADVEPGHALLCCSIPKTDVVVDA
ncbi:MAG: 2Fe-2S iron-sulfur cluster-binding protein [Opitutales bacterium]